VLTSQTFPWPIAIELTARVYSWPDLLLNRLLASTDNPSLQSLSIINQAAGGNRILTDGGGPSVLSRVDRDVLAHSSVTHAIIFEGVNDILNAPSDAEAQTALAQRMIWALKQIVERLHTQNIVVVGGTIAPFSEPGGNNVNRETTRRTVNEWIRTGRVFDSVVDFEKVLADPKSPEQLLEAYDTGDHLHLSVAGFQAMVDAFQLDVFDLGLPQGTRKPQ
jgi:lysophospholipase L1-like esterase